MKALFLTLRLCGSLGSSAAFGMNVFCEFNNEDKSIIWDFSPETGPRIFTTIWKNFTLDAFAKGKEIRTVYRNASTSFFARSSTGDSIHGWTKLIVHTPLHHSNLPSKAMGALIIKNNGIIEEAQTMCEIVN